MLCNFVKSLAHFRPEILSLPRNVPWPKICQTLIIKYSLRVRKIYFPTLVLISHLSSFPQTNTFYTFPCHDLSAFCSKIIFPFSLEMLHFSFHGIKMWRNKNDILQKFVDALLPAFLPHWSSETSWKVPSYKQIKRW